MSLATIVAAIVVALLVSMIGAAIGLYLQTRLKRLEELEERFAPSAPPMSRMDVRGMSTEVLSPVPSRKVEEETPTAPLALDIHPSVMASLRIVQGARKGESFTLSGYTLIGRDPVLCDIVLDDPTVSRRHARLRREGVQFYIYDLGSANGTFVNGELISRAELHDGDRIQLGNTVLEFKARQEGEEGDAEA